MWLLNVETIELEAFFDNSVPKYAILSHTWGEDEVTFQDIMGPDARHKQGYIKIEYTCRQAQSDGYSHVWIDTCCIDKSSSAELSEAINSMYRWYENSAVCYAYLADVSDRSISLLERSITELWQSDFAQCKWLKRGWTLQELIAPQHLIFYGEDWVFIGSKHKLVREISIITRIDQSILTGDSDLNDISIAKRMSWAAARKTTRVEDQAYSLLGIFGVNMPMLYGEGNRAFFRLQEEIIKTSTDQSILAWESCSGYKGPSIFASSPLDFRRGYRIVQCNQDESDEPYQMTNKGLRIKLLILDIGPKNPASENKLATLNCRFEDDFRGPIAIQLHDEKFEWKEKRLHELRNIHRVWSVERNYNAGLSVVNAAHLPSAKQCEVTILREPTRLYAQVFNDNPRCWLRIDDGKPRPGCKIVDVFPRTSWNLYTGVLFNPPLTPKKGSALLRAENGRSFIISFGYVLRDLFFRLQRESSFESWLDIFPGEEGMTLEKACEDCLRTTQSATLRINDFEVVRAEIKWETIMNEGLFVVEVSLDKILR